MTEQQRSEPVVIISHRPWTCAACAAHFERGEFLTMDDAGPLCMACADFAHLEFLPRGDAALTRRAKKASALSPVVVEWSRSRRRYERQGVLADTNAINQAEQECLADSEIRARRRLRDIERRQHEDETFVASLAVAVQTQFPRCPPERALRIAQHAGVRGSGRIGRSSWGRALDPEAVRLAVIAAVRHEDTPYDELLMLGEQRAEARQLVRDEVNRVIDDWSAGDSGVVQVGRVYDQPSGDGSRVLVDRLWPRGIRKDDPRVGQWLPKVAPSKDLRKWYGHAPEKFGEFRRRYEQELSEGEAADAFSELQKLARGGDVTLVTSTRDVEISHAAVLAILLG